MKIKRIETWHETMDHDTPYTIAYETILSATNVFIRIETDRGVSGFGCAAPDKAVTGETADDVIDALEGMVRSEIVGSNPLRYALLLHRLKSSLPSFPSTLAAVDMALYDILGKVADLPLYQVLGAYRTKMKTSITVGILDEDDTVRCARDFVNQGFKALKIKGGIDWRSDAARIQKVREAVGRSIEIRFDANQGYTTQDAIQFVSETRSAKLELIEQPTPQTELNMLGRVTRTVSIPVMADESLLNLRDAFRIVRRKLADMVNIKLMKIGGISEGMAINAVAKAAGVDVMVGCMDEAALGIAAGLHFALSRPNVRYADLDGHIGLKNDPSDGVVIIRDGYLFPPTSPGLGWR